MSKKYFAWFLVLALAIPILLTACGTPATEAPPEPPPPTEVPPALAALGVSLEDLDALEERVNAALEQARDLFGV